VRLEDARVVVATPVAGGEAWGTFVATAYSESIRMLQQLVPVQTIAAVTCYSVDNIRARNRVAAKVLRESHEATHVLWWDCDNWPMSRTVPHALAGDGGLSLLREMVESGEDMIACGYTRKRLPVRWVHQQLPGAVESGGMVEVHRVGFGFTMTSRQCLERLSASVRRYTDRPEPHKVAAIFNQLYDLPPGMVSDDPEDEDCLSEDFSFCKRWRDLGGRIMLTTSHVIAHSGAHVYSVQEAFSCNLCGKYMAHEPGCHGAIK
jgi:hypothetical protein